MVNFLSDMDRQVLEAICHKVCVESPSEIMDKSDLTVSFLKGICLGLVQNRFNGYYNAVNLKQITDEERNEMVRVTRSKIDEYFVKVLGK